MTPAQLFFLVKASTPASDDGEFGTIDDLLAMQAAARGVPHG